MCVCVCLPAPQYCSELYCLYLGRFYVASEPKPQNTAEPGSPRSCFTERPTRCFHKTAQRIWRVALPMVDIPVSWQSEAASTELKDPCKIACSSIIFDSLQDSDIWPCHCPPHPHKQQKSHLHPSVKNSVGNASQVYGFVVFQNRFKLTALSSKVLCLEIVVLYSDRYVNIEYLSSRLFS